MDDRGFREETVVGESRINWEGIESIISIDTHTFIYTGSQQAYVIPKGSVIEGDYDAFVAHAKESFQQKCSALTT